MSTTQCTCKYKAVGTTTLCKQTSELETNTQETEAKKQVCARVLLCLRLGCHHSSVPNLEPVLEHNNHSWNVLVCVPMVVCAFTHLVSCQIATIL